MSLVPAAAAAVYCAGDPAGAQLCGAALRGVGRRTEVDLVTVAASDPDLAAALASWWESTQLLWAAAAGDGDVGGHRWVRTRRSVVAARQSVAKGSRADLVAEHEALADAGPLASVVAAATAARPDVASVDAVAGALGGSFEYRPEEDRGLLELPMTGSLLWPDALGGPAWPGEVSRMLRLDLRYAAWRDRRVRRIAAVDVEVTEMWADPGR